MGNYKDSKIQTLARKGNGNFSYLDNYIEAQKVLMKEFSQTLYAVADDAYMNVEFNPNYVKSYRLLGFDNKMGALKDSLATMEGGEIGSGFSMMGIFEIERTELLDTIIVEKFAQIKLHYKLPNDTTSRSFSYKSLVNYEEYSEIPKSYRFATSIATFGSLLRFSPFTRAISWNNVLVMAQESADNSDKLQAEFVALVEQAKTLYSKGKKKKKNE